MDVFTVDNLATIKLTIPPTGGDTIALTSELTFDLYTVAEELFDLQDAAVKAEKLMRDLRKDWRVCLKKHFHQCPLIDKLSERGIEQLAVKIQTMHQTAKKADRESVAQG